MEIVTFTIILGILLTISILNQRFYYVGTIAGIGIIILALLITIDPLTYVSGHTETINTTANTATLTYIYTPLTQWMSTSIMLIIMGAGLIILLRSIGEVR
jgi:hypothetical protein